jgi:hypothetical protein
MQPVSKQRIGKHVPVSTNTHAIITVGNSKDVSTEAEESPLLRAVTKQRLVKTLQAGEYLMCSALQNVEISDGAI